MTLEQRIEHAMKRVMARGFSAGDAMLVMMLLVSQVAGRLESAQGTGQT